MNFGEKIKRRRNVLGISAEELAEKVAVEALACQVDHFLVLLYVNIYIYSV